MMIFKKVEQISNHIEIKIREKLIRHPIIYAFIGGIGVISFWRGVWRMIDYAMESYTSIEVIQNAGGVQSLWWDGPLSIAFGMLLLLPTGLFISSFIGTEIAISGLKGEKKIVTKTEQEVGEEVQESTKIEREIKDIDNHMKYIEELLKKK